MAGTLGEDVPNALAALKTVATVRAAEGVQNGADYPDGDFAQALQDIAAMLRAEVGLQVATVDVGGWDTHTDEAKDLDGNLGSAARALSAFMTDLGPQRRKRVTVVVQTEFGRRVEMNASGGTDHGHGSVMWLLGGGLARSDVFGKWTPLTAGALDDGDVPGVNNPFDVFGELLQARLGAGSLQHRVPRPRASQPSGRFTADVLSAALPTDRRHLPWRYDAIDRHVWPSPVDGSSRSTVTRSRTAPSLDHRRHDHRGRRRRRDPGRDDGRRRHRTVGAARLHGRARARRRARRG